MKNLPFILFFFLALFIFNIKASNHNPFIKADEIASSIIESANDQEKEILNDSLKLYLEELFVLNGKIELSHFKELQTIVVLSPSDSQFVFFNWSIPLNDGTYRYECGLWVNDSQKKKFTFLEAAPKDSANSETWVGEANQWIPGLYYDLIELQGKFNSYYTLLKWDGNNLITSKKSIEICYIDRSKDLRFGVPIIKGKSGKLSRMVFEYSAQNKMMLRYNKNLQRIEFDHLSPPDNTLIGVYAYYGPDLSHDGLYWRNMKWEYEEIIDLEEGLKNKKKDFKEQEEKKEAIIKEKKSIYEPTPLK